MRIEIRWIFTIMLLINCTISVAQKQRTYPAIYSGTPWFDDQGNVVSAHGACIIKDNGKYYLFGESHSDTSNAFAGFNCYASPDLYNWKFEGQALPVQDSGRLGPNRVGERVKVMKSPKTGEYVMYMHTDNLGYRDPCVGYATSRTVAGPYTFQGPLLFKGSPIRKWDMGTFQDSDGTGYLLIHGGNIFELSEDYKSITRQVLKSMCKGCESPAVFKKDNVYYWLGSHLTSWERNDNSYFTANALEGPWVEQGNFAPEGTLTWNAQTTFVFPIEGSEDTTYMFMGDRWSYPRQNSSATYVWQPLSISGTSLSIPEFHEAWQVDISTGVASPSKIKGRITGNTTKKLIKYDAAWVHSRSDTLSQDSRSDVTNARCSIKLKGRQFGVYSIARPNGGYAQVILQNSKGDTVLSSIIDMYCKYPVPSLRFLTPVLESDHYVLTISVLGERGNWSDKRKSKYGSTGNFVSIDKIVVHK